MSRQRTLIVIAILGLVFGGVAFGDDTEALIELDKQWGAAAVAGDMDAVGALLADDVVAVSEDGIHGKEHETMADDTIAEGTVYEPTDFEVRFLDEETAIMTHAVAGENAHYSLHVWSKKSGTWQVIATASAPGAPAED